MDRLAGGRMMEPLTVRSWWRAGINGTPAQYYLLHDRQYKGTDGEARIEWRKAPRKNKVRDGLKIEYFQV